MGELTQKEKDDLVLLSHVKGATLDGQPATVMGRLNRFATVGQINGNLTVKYSWQAVKRRMNKDRVFTA